MYVCFCVPHAGMAPGVETIFANTNKTSILDFSYGLGHAFLEWLDMLADMDDACLPKVISLRYAVNMGGSVWCHVEVFSRTSSFSKGGSSLLRDFLVFVRFAKGGVIQTLATKVTVCGVTQ